MCVYIERERSRMFSTLKKAMASTTTPNTSLSDAPSQGSAPKDSDSVRVPLLLNPIYARAKSSVFDELRNFRICLKWCALDHSTAAGRAISYAAFVALALLVPAATSLSVRAPPSSPSASSVSFHKLVQLPASGLAAISFFTLAAFFRRYGLRQLLFLDGALRDDSPVVRHRYTRELDRAFRHLVCILLPSFAVEIAHKVLFFSTVSVGPSAGGGVPWSSVVFVATVASWVYRTGVFLLVCVLFRLTCELQILRFEGLYKMFGEGDEGDADPDTGDIFAEHARIKRQLLATSHRYRIFILGCLVAISASQLGALMLVLASKSKKTFCNSGDVVVCSAVQLSGFFMCLLGAARITHRAQRVICIATRWHFMLSSSSSSTPPDSSSQTPGIPANEVDISDLDLPAEGGSIDNAPTSSNSAFQARQALVMYLQHNGGGITLFGFALDRGLLHTLFVFETTLVLWILSKVVVLS